jgi:DNA-binding transcriptional regulator GbsR (MarR family)
MVPDVYGMPFDTTQDGIASALGISRAHASIELKKLIGKGQVGSIIAHTSRSSRKRIAYYLQRRGLSAVPRINEHMRKENIAEESVFIGQQYPYELKMDPCTLKAMREIEKAAKSLSLGRNKSSIVHLTTAIKELAAREVVE